MQSFYLGRLWLCLELLLLWNFFFTWFSLSAGRWSWTLCVVLQEVRARFSRSASLFPHHSLPSLIDAFLYDLSITISYKCLVGSAPPALMHPPRRPRALLFKAIWIFAAERELMKRAIKYFTQKMYLGIRILEC